jgi:hypothetical protein
LNFSSYIQSCQVHIHAVFTFAHACMHWHNSQRSTALSCNSPKSYALTVTVVAVQRWKQFCTKTCIFAVQSVELPVSFLTLILKNFEYLH